MPFPLACRKAVSDSPDPAGQTSYTIRSVLRCDGKVIPGNLIKLWRPHADHPPRTRFSLSRIRSLDKLLSSELLTRGILLDF